MRYLFLRRLLSAERENLRSPGFAKLWTDQRLDPPALLTAMDAPQAFRMVGDFSALVSEEAPLLTVLQISTSSLVFWGAEPPVFRRFFALCRLFRGGVGYLPYPRGENGTRGRQRLLLFFYSVGGMWFVSVFSAAKAIFPSGAAVCRICHQMRSSSTSEAEKIHFSCRQHLHHTFTTGKEMMISP